MAFSVLLPIWLSLFQLCDSHSCRSLALLKALAKNNGNLFAIAFKSEKEPSKKKQRTDIPGSCAHSS